MSLVTTHLSTLLVRRADTCDHMTETAQKIAALLHAAGLCEHAFLDKDHPFLNVSGRMCCIDICGNPNFYLKLVIPDESDVPQCILAARRIMSGSPSAEVPACVSVSTCTCMWPSELLTADRVADLAISQTLS